MWVKKVIGFLVRPSEEEDEMRETFETMNLQAVRSATCQDYAFEDLF